MHKRIGVSILLAGCALSSEEPAERGVGAVASAAGAELATQTAVRIARPAWPPPSDVDAASLASLPAQARAAIASAPVPALVPASPSLASRLIVTAGEHYFAFSASDGAIALSLHASRLFYRHGDIALRGDRPLRGARGLVTRNEGIWSASWIEREVAYTLELECARHDDPRCTGERHLVEAVESLRYVGGAGR